MKGKNLAVLLVLMLLLGWLVASSISSFQELVPSSTGTSSGTSGGSSGSGGSSSGQGSGTGSGGSGGGNGQGSGGGSGGLNFGFPFNLNFTGSFKLPQLNLKLGNLTLPKINLSGFKLPFKFNFGNGSNSTSGKNGSGQSGSTGGGSSGSNPTQPAQVTPLHINTTLLIALIVAIAALISIVVVRQVVTQRRDNKPENDDYDSFVQEDAPTDDESGSADAINMHNIGPHEKTVPYSGWDPGNGLISFNVDDNLPLVWEKTAPLEFRLAKGAKLREPSVPEGSAGDSLSYVPVETCTLFNAKKLTLEDRLWLRAVAYENEIRRLFLLNFDASIDNFKNMTSREIMRKILEENKTVKDEKALESLISTYERTFYGKKKPERNVFETYMLSMHTALEEARIIICADD